MNEFKVGDVIENVCDMDDCGPCHIAIGDRFTVTEVSNTSVYFVDKMNCHRYRPSLYYKLHYRAPETPPAAIEHEGYTYTRGERVCPDWLKDGAWVVSRRTGILYKVTDAGNNRFYAASGDGSNNCGSISASGFSRAYRPHEPKDYKWGDWAMYDGKKVFVMAKITPDGRLAVSYPNMDGNCEHTGTSQWDYIHTSKLTPTHAP